MNAIEIKIGYILSFKKKKFLVVRYLEKSFHDF
jgi:hypothetical protein